MITQADILQNEVRALSWKPPFSELMLHGKQETRTWATNFRGLVLICSSAQPYADRELIAICGDEQYARILQLLGPKWYNVAKRGNAIAVGRLTECLPMNDQAPADTVEAMEAATFVKNKPGLYIHFYEDVTPIQTFPWRGSLGWKTLTPEEKQKIKLL